MALGRMPRLKRLNLSRNKFNCLHQDFLVAEQDFRLLQELDFSYNVVYEEEDLWYCTHLKSLQLLDITGNPLGL